MRKFAGSRDVEHFDWEWADVDGERIVWSESGKLFAARVADSGLVDRKELFDFSTVAFEERVAPY